MVLLFFFISERICLCCYVELLPANMFCAVICYFCKRIWLRWFMEFFLKLLCSRSYAFLLLVLFMLLARSGFTRSVFIFCLCFLAFSFLYCRVISIIRKGLTFRLPGGVVSYPSMLCPRGRAFRGCPTSGSLTFLLMFYFCLSRFLCLFSVTLQET